METANCNPTDSGAGPADGDNTLPRVGYEQRDALRPEDGLDQWVHPLAAFPGSRELAGVRSQLSYSAALA